MEPVMGVGSNIVIRGGLQGWSGMGKGTRSAMALAEGGGGLGVGVRVAAHSRGWQIDGWGSCDARTEK